MTNSTIMTFDHALPSEICDLAIDLFDKSLDKYPGETGFGLHENRKRSLDLDIDETLPEWQETNDALRSSIADMINRYATDHSGFSSYGDLKCTGFRIHKYPRMTGHFDWHIDLFDASVSHRVLSVVWYLNTVSDGGATEFETQGQAISPKRGTALVFPSNFEYVHRSQPNLSDDKYVVVAFVELDTSLEDGMPKNEVAVDPRSQLNLTPESLSTTRILSDVWRSEWHLYTSKLVDFVAHLVDGSSVVRNTNLVAHLDDVAAARAKLDPRVYYCAWHGLNRDLVMYADLARVDPVWRGERPKVIVGSDQIWGRVLKSISRDVSEGRSHLVDLKVAPSIGNGDLERISAALEHVRNVWPEAYSQIVDCIHSVVIVQGVGLRSSVLLSMFGAIFVSLKPEYSTLDIADLLVHETAHTALSIKQGLIDFVTNPDDRCHSPLRSDLRPVDGVLHSTFVLSRVVELRRRSSSYAVNEEDSGSLPSLEDYESFLEDGILSLINSAKLTSYGIVLLNDFKEACRGY